MTVQVKPWPSAQKSPIYIITSEYLRCMLIFVKNTYDTEN